MGKGEIPGVTEILDIGVEVFHDPEQTPDEWEKGLAGGIFPKKKQPEKKPSII